MEHLEASGFYHTALDSLMDSLFISSTPILEPQRCRSRIRKTLSVFTPDEDKFFSICSTTKQSTTNSSTTNSGQLEGVEAEESSSSPGEEDGGTPKRVMRGARKQQLFVESQTEEFKPRLRSCNTRRELSPQTQLLKKAILRMECLQRRQDRIEQSKRPMRTSLRV